MKLKHLIIAAALLASCSAEKTYKIGVSQCGAGQWREKVNSEMLAAQHLYDQNAKVIIACAYDDTDRQIHQIDSLVESGIDLLVIAPNESKELDDAITKVQAKDIPVIYFDRKAATNNYTAFIGGSNVEAGITMGQYAASLGGKFVMEITGAMSTSPAQERHDGFSHAMAEHKDINYVWKEADWTSDEAYRIVEEQIKTGQLPDVVFCHNDGMATGVYKAVVESGIEGQIKIIGIDGLPGEGIEYVQFGHQVGTYVYPTHGEEIVKLALDILTGKPYERENTLQGMLVTPENANIADLNSRELMRQNNNLITIQDKLEGYFGLYNTQHKILIASFVTIAVLILAFIMIAIAYWLRRKTIRQRQAMNEEQTLFYTDASNRKLHEIFVKPEEELPSPKSQDMLFAEQLNEAIHKNMSNPNLKMDDLGEEMGLSRVQLYRKVKAITGQTPVELLRQMRLQQAYALLTSTTKTVGEIAYEVGFGTPGYFSTCFKKQFGKYPTDLRAE
jgi:ABC-type sugar transport system substrate-binding protein/AraC-like DNA-binding protein